METYNDYKIWSNDDPKMKKVLTMVWAVSLVIAIAIALVTLIG